MGTNETTNTTPLPQMRPEEMRRLAKRLRARAQGVLLRHQPEQHRDLVTAASHIEHLVHLLAEIRRAADSTEDESTERHLREMLGGA